MVAGDVGRVGRRERIAATREPEPAQHVQPYRDGPVAAQGIHRRGHPFVPGATGDAPVRLRATDADPGPAIGELQQAPDRFVLFNGCYPDRYTLEQNVEAFRTRHFPKAKTFEIPLGVVMAGAQALRPVSSADS